MNKQKQAPSTNGALPHDAIQAAKPASEAIQARRYDPPRPVDPRSANRRTLAIVLALMGGMAILGLVFALWTVPLRRANDNKAGAPPLSQPISQPER